jgi:hypothetical protein
MIEEAEYIIPIYIDTNALLDLLASIEGGFNLVEKVSSRTSESASFERQGSAEIGTEFGIPNILSLLKLSLKGTITSTKGEDVDERRETEKYYTYGSLFHRLRIFLEEENLLKSLSNEAAWENIRPSDFIEIHGLIRPNPLTDSLQRLDKLLSIIQLLGPSVFNSSTSKGKAQSEVKQMRQIRDFFAGVLKDIEAENVRKFVVDAKGIQGLRLVILLFLDYLRDKSMSEISFKEFRLIGKVVRKVEPNSNDSIDLLSGTGLGGIGKDTLANLFLVFSQIEGMSLPEIETDISGPALEIVPIAIYV